MSILLKDVQMQAKEINLSNDISEWILPKGKELFPEHALFLQKKLNELKGLLELYLHLHESTVPEMTEQLNRTWSTIVQDRNHHIVIKVVDNKIVSSCVCVIIPNLTRNVRPYAIIENVVTHKDYRGKGYASECLAYAKGIAKKGNCYKMMLLTGSKKESTMEFYKSAGYNCSDKTAFVQWIE